MKQKRRRQQRKSEPAPARHRKAKKPCGRPSAKANRRADAAKKRRSTLRSTDEQPVWIEPTVKLTDDDVMRAEEACERGIGDLEETESLIEGKVVGVGDSLRRKIGDGYYATKRASKLRKSRGAA